MRGCRCALHDCRPSITDCRSRERRLSIADSPDCRFPIADCRLSIAPRADYPLPIDKRTIVVCPFPWRHCRCVCHCRLPIPRLSMISRLKLDPCASPGLPPGLRMRAASRAGRLRLVPMLAARGHGIDVFVDERRVPVARSGAEAPSARAGARAERTRLRLARRARSVRSAGLPTGQFAAARVHLAVSLRLARARRPARRAPAPRSRAGAAPASTTRRLSRRIPLEPAVRVSGGRRTGDRRLRWPVLLPVADDARGDRVIPPCRRAFARRGARVGGELARPAGGIRRARRGTREARHRQRPRGHPRALRADGAADRLRRVRPAERRETAHADPAGVRDDPCAVPSRTITARRVVRPIRRHPHRR